MPAGTSIADSVLTGQQNEIEGDSVLRSVYITENSVHRRTFPVNFKRKYRGADFSYETVKPKESFWSRVQRKFKRMMESIFGKSNPKTSARVTQTVLWLLVIAAVAVVLYFLLNYLANRQGGFLFGKRNRKIHIEDSDITENIHEINFSENILKFEREKNYRSAVRYQFLQVLKRIADKKLIDWNPEKTNKDYLAEIKNSDQKRPFAELVRIFDYVWYGEFDIDEAAYLNYREKFTGFKI